jgi:hypothetical protein
MRRETVLLLSVFLLGACATMRPGFEEPTVSLTSFRALPTEGMATRRDALDYTFDAKLDLGGLYPSIRVSEGGRLELGDRSPR